MLIKKKLHDAQTAYNNPYYHMTCARLYRIPDSKKKIPVRSGASTKQPWECAKKEKNREKKKKEKGPYC